MAESPAKEDPARSREELGMTMQWLDGVGMEGVSQM